MLFRRFCSPTEAGHFGHQKQDKRKANASAVRHDADDVVLMAVKYSEPVQIGNLQSLKTCFFFVPGGAEFSTGSIYVSLWSTSPQDTSHK